MTLLQLEAISYQKQNKMILQVDELSLKRGDHIGIIGPNGAGKSTLLNILAMLEPPTSGTITFDGMKINPNKIPISLRHRTASVFQHSQRFDMTVFQNVALGLKIKGIAKNEREQRVHEWLTRFRIDHLSNEHAYNLSGGEAQRMNLARAFALEPEALFMDEPFSALDAPTKASLMYELKSILRERDITAIFVSHDLLEIEAMSEKLAVIIDGRIIQKGNVRDVLNAPSDIAAPFLHAWNQLKQGLDPGVQ
ncbi:ABC transporter ATP-binding protein [Texcoconibacillus texcoconensis]|uniref:Tungstate transport system ATP-binding protein n=1 Tax=Texcoconibacillus texcoconensis TaxID=1095777 RepID=A0A840QPN4_9BACI|nr:ATP-binding cassette domain-containing protein [Texcoconibacillus texcoconensis]MBB5173283.1 tungstate transport system ATP-binding protein [Texcoconibacillus texcoconensis]